MHPEEARKQFEAEKVTGMNLRHIVRSKQNALESKNERERRMNEAQSFLPVERLALRPQCGFASIREGNPLAVTGRKATWRTVAETAREIYDRTSIAAHSNGKGKSA